MSWTESDHARLVALKHQRAAMRRGPDEEIDKDKLKKLTIEIKAIKLGTKGILKFTVSRLTKYLYVLDALFLFSSFNNIELRSRSIIFFSTSR